MSTIRVMSVNQDKKLPWHFTYHHKDIFFISFCFPNKEASDFQRLQAHVYKHRKWKFPNLQKINEKNKRGHLNSAGSIKKKKKRKNSPGGLNRSSFFYLGIMDTMWGTPGLSDKAVGWMKKSKEEVAYLCFPKSTHPEIICCILR